MKQERNVIMHGASGGFMDQIVFRNRAGKTVLCAPPLLDKDRKPTADQLAIQEEFKEAVSYASGAIKDLGTKAAYAAKAEPGQSAYNVAFADFFNEPEVNSINKDNYLGGIGNTLTIKAKDDFKVTEVKVVITGADGSVIEQEAAVLQDNGEWLYTTTQANATLAGTKITATATDLPGHTGSLTVTL
jgi:hypothetical protein